MGTLDSLTEHVPTDGPLIIVTASFEGEFNTSHVASASLTESRVARDNDFDVVLIDTAGRMQDNEVRRVAPMPFDVQCDH